MFTIRKQILPLQGITRFNGAIHRANNRRRIELNSKFKKFFEQLNENSSWTIEVTLSKDKLLERIKELIEEEEILPSLIYFQKQI